MDLKELDKIKLMMYNIKRTSKKPLDRRKIWKICNFCIFLLDKTKKYWIIMFVGEFLEIP